MLRSIPRRVTKDSCLLGAYILVELPLGYSYRTKGREFRVNRSGVIRPIKE